MDKSLYVVIMYILTHVGLILFLYPSNIIESSSQGQWIPIIIGVIVHFIILFLLLTGLDRFPQQDIITIYLHEGKLMTFIFLFPTLLYFFMANIITVRAYSEVVTIVFLSNTPLWAIMALLLILSCYLAIKGVEAIFRTAILLFFLLFPLVCFILVVAFQNVDWHYVYPLWNEDFSFLTDSSYHRSFFAIGGVFLFIGFIRPVLPYKRKKVLLAAVALIPIFIISVYIPVLTFGQATASTFMFPFIMTVDAINLTWLMFDRLTMFFLLSIVIFILLFISLVLWMSVEIINKCLLPTMKSSYLVIAVSLIIYIICLWIPNWSDVEQLFKWNTSLRFYVIFGVPISIWILGVRARKENASEV
ncbi:GerAB/ArcD/ProY family transporter [Rossellomorea sp. NPDC071047]|uniref:GerAB/ArcD/ProY family transporter n=1 Tax=Rossellomorea sp. NPDC071047 TaxID=3390675 RepID=UPI003D02BBCD